MRDPSRDITRQPHLPVTFLPTSKLLFPPVLVIHRSPVHCPPTNPTMTPTLTGGRVPTHIHPAVLKVIDLHVLQNGSQAQADLLLGAAVTDGFFYLDFSHPSYRGVLDSAEAVLQLAAEIFNHHDETKRLFDVDLASPMKTNGYKPKGRNIVSKDGTRDSFESWAVSCYNNLTRTGIHLTREMP